jgi:hypothetical protein
MTMLAIDFAGDGRRVLVTHRRIRRPDARGGATWVRTSSWTGDGGGGGTPAPLGS